MHIELTGSYMYACAHIFVSVRGSACMYSYYFVLMGARMPSYRTYICILFYKTKVKRKKRKENKKLKKYLTGTSKHFWSFRLKRIRIHFIMGVKIGHSTSKIYIRHYRYIHCIYIFTNALRNYIHIPYVICTHTHMSYAENVQ